MCDGDCGDVVVGVVWNCLLKGGRMILICIDFFLWEGY